MEDIGSWLKMWFRIFIAGLFIVAVIMAAGGALGYYEGYNKGIKECNDATIRKQLGI